MLKLQPAPTFKARVGIPVPGQDKTVQVMCTFAHMTRDEYAAFSIGEGAAARSDVDSIMAILRGWDEADIDAAFSREAVALLIQQYHGAAFAIAEAYAIELKGARAKN